MTSQPTKYLRCENRSDLVNVLIPVDVLEYQKEEEEKVEVRQRWCRGCINGND